MATHNGDDGTGGLDASLHFELDRGEVCRFSFEKLVPLIQLDFLQNVGFGMIQTQGQFDIFPNKYISSMFSTSFPE